MESPVNHLDSDGTVTCAFCGLDLTLDPRVWARVIGVSHELVDLSAVNPDVRSAPVSSPLKLDNPYRNIGVNVSERSYDEPGVVGGRAALGVRVSPGSPLCPGCRSPLAWQAVGSELMLGCGTCGRSERYARDAFAAQASPALSAVAAQPLRSDVRHATSHVRPDGVAQLVCPNCGAPLAVQPDSAQVVCSHCQAPALVSSKLWFRLGVREPRVEPIWLLFSGPSARRQALVNAASDVDPFEAELEARARAAMAAVSAPPAAPPSYEATAPVSAPPVVEALPVAMPPASAAPAAWARPSSMDASPGRASRGSGRVLLMVALVGVLLVGIAVVAAALTFAY